MKNGSAADDDLLPKYDISSLTGAVVAKYYKRATTTPTNLVLIDPDLTSIFPDSQSVNRALRLLADTARAATPAARGRKPRKRT